MSVLKDSEGRVLLDENGDVKLTSSIKSVKANGVNNYAETGYGTNANSVLVVNGKFNSNGTTQSIGARGATTGRFFFNKQSTGEWALGWGDSALVGGISDTELHTFILYDAKLWIVNKIDDLINNQSELINVINSTTPTISLTANWVVFAQTIFIGARNYFGSAETFADFTHYETLIAEYDGITWTDKHYFTNYTPSKLKDTITGNIVEWQGSTPLLYSLDLASPDRKPIFALSANSYKTIFDETNAEIVKSDAGNEVVFLPVAGSQIPVIEDGGILFDHLLTSKLKASKVPVNIDFTNFTKQIKIKLNSATGNDFTIFKIGEEVGTNNIALMIYVDSSTVWFRVKKSASFSTFGIDVSAIDINNPINITFGVKNQTAYLSCNNYFKKITLGEDIDTFYATQMFAGGIYSDVEIINGFILYETRWYNTSVIDPADYTTNSEFPDIAINNIKPPSILPPQPLYELRGDNRVYGVSKPAVDKWVDSQDSGLLLKTPADGEYNFTGYTNPLSELNHLNFRNEYTCTVDSNFALKDYGDFSFVFRINVNASDTLRKGIFGIYNGNLNQASTSANTAILVLTLDNLLKIHISDGVTLLLMDFQSPVQSNKNSIWCIGMKNSYFYAIVDGTIIKRSTGSVNAINASITNMSIGMPLVKAQIGGIMNPDFDLYDFKYYPTSIIDPTDYITNQKFTEAELYSIINRREGVEISHRDLSVITNTGTSVTGIKDLLKRTAVKNIVGAVQIANRAINYSDASAHVVLSHDFSFDIDMHMSFGVIFSTPWIYGREYGVAFSTATTGTNPYFGILISTLNMPTNRYNVTVYDMSGGSGNMISSNFIYSQGEYHHVELNMIKGDWVGYHDGLAVVSGYRLPTDISEETRDLYYGNINGSGGIIHQATDVKILPYPIHHTNFAKPTRSIK